MDKEERWSSSTYDASAYGEGIGDYDLLYPPNYFDTDEAVNRLANLVGASGSILELGIGTGRLAIPLSQRGYEVAGIDVSPSMIAQLREKPDSASIEVRQGNFIDHQLPRTFSLVVLAANGIVDPPTRQAQTKCFANAARHLEPSGLFVVETYVLQPDQLGTDWTIWPRFVRADHVELQLSRFDSVSSTLERTMVHLREDGVRFVTVKDNYAWPGELDLMAKSVGLRLESRHSGWSGEPFEATSRKHVSTYRKVCGD
jgi:SAM-dependent methyltransferase